MAQILVSTTGTLSPVPVDDLGAIEFVHPTTDFVIFDTNFNVTPFNLEEIRDSTDLQTQLDAGHLTMKFDNGVNITNVAEAAALLDTAITNQNIRCGQVLAGTLTGNPKGATVTFIVPFSDTNYDVLMTPQTTNSTDKFVANYYNKTTTGFDFDIGTNSTTNLVAVSYIACRRTDVV